MFDLNLNLWDAYAGAGKVGCSFDTSVVTLAQCVLKVCILAFYKCDKSDELEKLKGKKME